MHTLSRQIRFMIDPFAPEMIQGYNSYASKPAGQGVGLYFSLWVDLESELDQRTGFVVNVSEIDKFIRANVIPIFTQTIQAFFAVKETPLLWNMVCLLRRCWPVVQAGFSDKRLRQLKLELNPFRQITIDSENAEMFTFSEKFEFAAMHQLWNEAFDEATNYEKFGKCANPAGHGHNYVLEVQVQSTIEQVQAGWLSDYQQVVEENFLNLVDHKNLNVDVSGFETLVPTVENLAFFAWEKLEDRFKDGKLVKVTVWENDRTYCSYTG
ncbi:MAG: 6-pyruvoyl trahydropterin synthase family protein [Planctomycetota bacterium]|jgi:6-pyruvoyltetrahydropterin/6-carboxytetrahydropterin synthase